MKITALRILPPIAIGRLGSADEPLAAFDLQLSNERPLDYRHIEPTSTFRVDPKTGEITEEKAGAHIQFKDFEKDPSLENKNGKIHPVAPFLEVFAITDENPDVLTPLTIDLLKTAGLSVADISWHVEVGNIKVFRRTGDVNDKISAKIDTIKTHAKMPLEGECNNFIKGKKLPLGHVQFIKPTKDFSEIRFRFTPAAGRVYGSDLRRITSDKPFKDETDPIIYKDSLILYDKNKKGATWYGYIEGNGPTLTNPGQIFAGFNMADGINRQSWGYLDDECDGFISVKLKTGKGELEARAHIGAGPPAFAPDSLPVRVMSDELEQILLSTDVDGEVSIEEAEDLIRRAFETIRLMNTAVMNGNSYEGKQNIASTMVRQNTNDFNRLYEPIMATSIVDNLALEVLHERVFNGLSTGAAPWFAELLRRPNEIGDLSSKALRKMPALMRGADGRSLTFTRRQINIIIKAAANAIFKNNIAGVEKKEPDLPIATNNLTAQLHYQGKGNPYSVLPTTAISNCFPGLEFDFRNLWRRTFKGIVLIENNNLVIDVEDKQYSNLKLCRLVCIAVPKDGEKHFTMVPTSGPVFPEGANVPLSSSGNPNGVSFMEWSNSMIRILWENGKKIKSVDCYFTYPPPASMAEISPEIVVNADDLKNKDKFRMVTLDVNDFFEENSAAFSKTILQPGELTQGLCAPWQNDYRECACYYWAASRPDYVNVVPDGNGLSRGDMWMAKKRTGQYIPDDRTDSRLLSYDDLKLGRGIKFYYQRKRCA